ncbi:ABC transporter related [Vibrio nigripulchritudo FTn2]|uniref:ABC transporter ATP-binding protein n=1 Tax=Vibrio nigripulchritudo TaxID=28173 RepID=UPI0003B1D370|nr:ABC transporter ATP-binding protein [Vibrio nigripulchritudo]CCN40090.1 ABC transporter related [Vibrio nigripulchritudo FTn2]
MSLQPYQLTVDNLQKSYGEKTVLKNVNLAIRKQEFVSLVGPSGCGKSSLLRIILGQEQACSGDVIIKGRHISDPTPSRGVVYQKYSLFPHLSVLDNVLLGVKHLGINGNPAPQAELVDYAMYYLERVLLQDAAHKLPHELSGGMQQRAAIAQALIASPEILLMDEPFAALDQVSRELLQTFLMQLHEELRMTVIFITHSLEEAAYLGTRLLALSQYYDGYPSAKGHGATIVEDVCLDELARSTDIKHKPEFLELVARIRRSAFDPDVIQSVDDFNLTHPDSFCVKSAKSFHSPNKKEL